ncbi:MAG: hypothetical protein DHS20C17_11880 [Cyclobacteriaceae bacterium]|nr:MAG: hypothetical protein DHS20C17_11880 [Cyclobacteriaceae bacterium]
MRTILSYILVLFTTIFCFTPVWSQNVKVDVGPGEIAANEAFTITVVVENDQLKNLSGFPEIEGLIKRGTSSSTSTQFINGQVSSTQSLTQNYVPQRQGTFTLPAFTISVNGQTVKVPGKSITVGPPRQQRRQTDPFATDPWEELFGNRRGNEEFIDVKADAFFALTTDKSEVYLGEGFNTSLAFYVSEQNRADLEFYDMSKQLTDILKKIRPSNCWEENFNVENIKREQVTIKNQRYQKYLIYQATFFPLNTEPIEFPSVGLKLIKYRMAKNPSFFGPSRQEDFKTFRTQAKTVQVKELPIHPLKNKVAVGDYQLEEQISGEQLQTGESFSYNFKIQGKGNISAIGNLEIPESDKFDLYPPSIQKTVHRRNGGVSGSHSFGFYAIPNEPGIYDLGDYFSWTFFNPRTEEYQTLKSNITVKVTGESKKNETILATDLGSFYDIIDLQGNNLKSRHQYEYFKVFANIFILVMLVLTAIFIFRK